MQVLEHKKMSETFVKLPSGYVEINHIREKIAEIKSLNFSYLLWHRRPGLRDKKTSFVSHLYTGQSFDEKSFELDEIGWDHDHCIVCFKRLEVNLINNEEIYGYFDGFDWVCKTCYEDLVLAEDLNKKLHNFETLIK